jgi:cytochrome c-type biogenesis protein CcmE
MTRKQKRVALILGIGAVLALAAGLIFVALRDEIVFFYSPSEIKEKAVAVGTPIRLGGLVKKDSCTKSGETTRFVVTDGETEMPVSFTGMLPDLFRSGQGVVTEGALDTTGGFIASNVLAKHDENYMPKEVVKSLKARGEWQREPQAVDLATDTCSSRNLKTLAETAKGG